MELLCWVVECFFWIPCVLYDLFIPYAQAWEGFPEQDSVAYETKKHHV
jgi:hypothetical protein